MIPYTLKSSFESYTADAVEFVDYNIKQFRVSFGGLVIYGGKFGISPFEDSSDLGPGFLFIEPGDLTNKLFVA
ncbi:MAG: hypothetical protein EBU84_18915, partial [Actinobacteria bacterium]|nr:hypothetical protein [Actinomycetota bacterium]